MQQSFECGLCGVPMTAISSPASSVRYHRCPSCSGWCASTYHEDAVRNGTVRPSNGTQRTRAWDSSFETIKGRLEQWLRSVDADNYAEEPARAVAGTVRPKASR
jgi:hypothetical protein